MEDDHPNAPEERLDRLDDGEFRELIDALLRNATDARTSRALRSSPLADRTRRTLESMDASVSSQLDARAADIETLEMERKGGGGLNDAQMNRFEVDYARWRASALRFRGHIREVLAGLPSSRAQELEEAIRAHRAAIDEDGEAADLALWSHLGDQ